jgi:hypothetical protein
MRPYVPKKLTELLQIFLQHLKVMLGGEFTTQREVKKKY